MDKIVMIEELEKTVSTLRELDYDSLNAFVLKSKLYVKKIFGEKSEYLNLIDSIDFHALLYLIDDDFSNNQNDKEAWRGGISNLKNIISTMKEDIAISESLNEESLNISTPVKMSFTTNKIFIVHGHDEEMKINVARLLEKLNLSPVILHEQPDRGRNILDKLIDESEDACFAIVLLSPDDIVLTGDKQTTRARQNVVLELGFFLAKLGKNRVTALYKASENFELPSDFAGVLYKKYDNGESWKVELARELRASGIPVDLNRLF